jgi:hypothetical protein
MTPLHYALIFCLLAPHAGWSGLWWLAIVAGLVVLLWLGKLRAFAVFCAWSTAAVAALGGLLLLHSWYEGRQNAPWHEANAKCHREQGHKLEEFLHVCHPSGTRAELVPTRAVVSPETVRESEEGTREMKERLGRALDEARAERRKRMTPSELAAAEAHDREMAALSDEDFDALVREPAEPPAEAAPEPKAPQRAPQKAPPVPRRPQPPLTTRI